MKFTIATGFDKTKQDEVFTTVQFGEPALREIVSGVLNRMEYAQREKLLRKFAAEGKLTVEE